MRWYASCDENEYILDAHACMLKSCLISSETANNTYYYS